MRLQLPEMAAMMVAVFHSSYHGLYPKGETKILDGDENDVRKAEATKLYKKVIIFYAHWCSHCQSVAHDLKTNQKEFYDPKTFYDEEGLPRVVAFDCARDDEANEFCAEQGVKGYPTFYTCLRDKKSGGVFPADPLNYVINVLKQIPATPPPTTTTTTTTTTTPTTTPCATTTPCSASTATTTTTTTTTMSTTSFPTPTTIITTPCRTSTTTKSSPTIITTTTTPTGGSIFPDEANATYAMRTLDGILAFAYALHTATFFPMNTTLIEEKLKTLEESLLPVIIAVHPDKEFREDVRGLLDNITQASGAITRAQWMSMLDGIAPRAMRQQPDAFWKHCNNFNCGLWQFFHSLTLGVGRRSNLPANDSAGEVVMKTIKMFVVDFFMCLECAQHFVKSYDGCAAGRCTMDHPDKRHTALWLWRLHNMVNNRTSHERGITGKDTAWPTKDECTKCREYRYGMSNNYTFNEDAVMDFLEESYYPQSSDVKPTGPSGTRSVVQLGYHTIALLSLAILPLIMVTNF
ncbi:Quiescin Q6 sulfhydryl oxidase [Perkinsus olseni]|uniref:Sulfhydryl oxidase n=1 Tax=Perkinsus olseni TaxID=32597 RepID=A0A7J6RFV1_PEROL|nr:Quiescin Q6 sulfhydryl oxidase [Perkinsus olseni]